MVSSLKSYRTKRGVSYSLCKKSKTKKETKNCAQYVTKQLFLNVLNGGISTGWNDHGYEFERSKGMMFCILCSKPISHVNHTRNT